MDHRAGVPANLGEPTPDGEAQVLNDRYLVVRPLGHGGMGAVTLVYDRQTGRHVALKSFPPRARRSEDLAHFEHEFLTLSRLRHPNVAEVYDFGVIEGTQDVFFTSEFIDGQDLLQVSAGLDEPGLARRVVEVCRGLEYIHSRGLIHYDVKPTNILVTSERVKLIDFGLAAEQVDEALGIIKGTVSYLSPEVARHLPVDHRADLYALGVTIFQCATRQLPFRGETNLDVVRKIVSQPTPDPRELGTGISDGLASIVMRLMAREPGARFQRGNEVIQALAALYGQDFGLEPWQEALPFVTSGGFFGREREFQALTGSFDRIFSWHEADDPLAELPRPGALSESGASSLLVTSTGFALAPDTRSALLAEPAPVPVSPSSFAIDWPTSSETATDVAPIPPAESRPGGAAVHLHLVSGETGMGKSRLLGEFKTHAQLRRVAVVEGTASPTGRAFDAFVQVIRSLLGLFYRDPDASAAAEPLRPTQGDALRRRLLQRYGAELVRLIPELDASTLPVTAPASLSPEQEKVRLLDALAQFLIGYGRVRPLVVLLHDLEHADQQTLELLRYLTRNLSLVESIRGEAERRGAADAARPLRLMVVASYRPSDLPLASEALLSEVAGERVSRRLELGPLGPDDVHTMVASMLGVGSEPRRLAERIYAESRGNPYFAAELLRALVERRALTYQDGRWSLRLDEPGAAHVPESMAAVILGRIRGVDEAERAPLHVLAALGRPASFPELAALCGESSRSLVGVLEGLERRQVLHVERRDDGRRYDFVHEVARDAVYQAIPPAERVALHARCADFLERRAGLSHSAVDLGELVRHTTEAGDRVRALDYGIRAGDEARAVHANHRALQFYGGALALLPQGTARWRELVLRTGELLLRTGDYEHALAALGRLLDPAVAGQASAPELARCYQRRAEVRERVGDFDGALEDLSLGAASVWAADGFEREAAGLLAATAAIYLRTGRCQDAIGFCEVALSRLRGVSECEEAALIHSVRGRSRLTLGEPGPAEADLERCLAIRRHLHDEAGVARALGDLGELALITGRPQEAVERFERAMERESAMGHAAGIAAAAAGLARAAQARGERERAAGLLRRALGIHERTGARAEAVQVRIELAEAALTASDYDEAARQLGEARREADSLGLLMESARAANAEARLHLRLGALEPAHAAASDALRWASLQGEVPRERAAALESLAGVAGAQGAWEDAELYLAQAQTHYRSHDDPGGVLRTTLALLELCLRRGERPLFEGVASTLPKDLAGVARSRYLLLKVRAACELGEGEPPPPALLGELERAAGLAEAGDDAELAWRIAAARGRLLVLLGEEESALASYVEAMSGIRDLLARVPEGQREAYVADPERVATRAAFLELRDRLAEER